MINGWVALAGGLAVAALFGVGFAIGDANGSARVQGYFDSHLNADEKAVNEAVSKARTLEQSLAEASAMIGAAYERGLKDANAQERDVVAGLRAGTTRLREQWAGCETGRLSEAVAAASVVDAAARDREASAGRIVRAAAECDAKVIGLQETLKKYLEATK